MELLDEFKMDILTTCKSKLNDIVEDYLISRPNWYFLKIDRKEFNLKNEISKIFSINIPDIFIVGSSQLGFSISPSKNKYKFNSFREFPDGDNEESDIDVAIISSVFFEEELEKLYNYLGGYHIKFINEKFCGIERGTDRKLNKVYYQDFSTYLLKGWLRSDKMPLDYKFLSEEIDLELKALRKKYNRKINIGIYKSYFYLINYHLKNIEKIQNYLEEEENSRCQ
ncbi:hypothetical protein CRU87_09000 [Aliarcobacter trophiarum LMG 25534]|uniref:Uncharacterized protein n=1 Tax=Aliarcobacter trophiarum LMG 25534 TaxID=1032241 RepID=A0AAD0QID7_9BACT|nr:hypothetical protein [Aliarcobacter trophiarum]AXK48447.1 hypothetical protein ATR_0574 [Aliarcobacter trophiarum LMG 25534]RXJ89578.1 hypothetical protein CRU87_09000 [Aliarcobacter trophiarum LMG 25534]